MIDEDTGVQVSAVIDGLFSVTQWTKKISVNQ